MAIAVAGVACSSASRPTVYSHQRVIPDYLETLGTLREPVGHCVQSVDSAPANRWHSTGRIHARTQPNSWIVLAARAWFPNSAWKQIPASPASPAQKRRPGSTRPPSIWLASTDSQPVGTKPTTGSLNPHGTTRSCSPLPRQCAEAPRRRQPPRQAAATRHPLRDRSRRRPGGCPRCY